jgi:hypothetical protein
LKKRWKSFHSKSKDINMQRHLVICGARKFIIGADKLTK